MGKFASVDLRRKDGAHFAHLVDPGQQRHLRGTVWRGAANLLRPMHCRTPSLNSKQQSFPTTKLSSADLEGLQQSLFAADSTLIQLAFTAFQESGTAIGLHLCKEVVLNLLGYDQLEIIRELALEDLLVLRTDQSLGSCPFGENWLTASDLSLDVFDRESVPFPFPGIENRVDLQAVQGTKLSKCEEASDHREFCCR